MLHMVSWVYLMYMVEVVQVDGIALDLYSTVTELQVFLFQEHLKLKAVVECQYLIHRQEILFVMEPMLVSILEAA